MLQKNFDILATTAWAYTAFT